MNKNLLIFTGVAILILGGVYWFSQPSEQTPSYSAENQQQVSADTSVATLEQELAATDIDSLGGEFADIDAEVEAAIAEAQ